MNDYVKRFQTPDGAYRVTIYRDEYAESPRDMTDLPLNCEDWDRNYSIMNRKEREQRSTSAYNLLVYLLRNFGDNNKVIGFLKDNAKKQSPAVYDNCIRYDRSRHSWVIYEYDPGSRYSSIQTPHWEEMFEWDGKLDSLTLYEYADELSEDTIDFLIEKGFLTDKVKVMGYDFGCYGSVSFHETPSSKSDGIAWMEMSEAVGGWYNEEIWLKESCFDLTEGYREEISAWADGECYIFEVEKAIKYRVRKECLSEERDTQDYESVEWENVDTCGGFYGDIDYAVQYACESNDLKKDDLQEVA